MKTKSILLAIVLAFSFLDINAQEGTIVYQNFEPDSCHFFTPPIGDLFAFDIEGNGTNDLAFQSYLGEFYSTWINVVVFDGWQVAIEHPAHPYPDSIPVQLDTLQYWNDTIGTFIPQISVGAPTYLVSKVFLRHKVGNDYYYAWVKTDDGWVDGQAYVCIEEFAFCTIPNYPLKWGQTDFTGIGELGESPSFASVHPNPTTGLVTVTGENLSQAEVFNMLGQQVLNVKGKGDELRIDMAALPAGIYFVNVTDKEGQKCMRKVVKE